MLNLYKKQFGNKRVVSIISFTLISVFTLMSGDANEIYDAGGIGKQRSCWGLGLNKTIIR